MRVNLKRIKLIISEGSLSQCGGKSLTSILAVAFVREVDLRDGLIGFQMVGLLHDEAAAG